MFLKVKFVFVDASASNNTFDGLEPVSLEEKGTSSEPVLQVATMITQIVLKYTIYLF
jgi:hypothetical protein